MMGDSQEDPARPDQADRERRARVLEESDGHDDEMPHDARYSRLDPRGCPPRCPARPALLARQCGRYPAMSWEEHGRPTVGVWWGFEDQVDQVYAGLPVGLSDTGGTTVMATFTGGMWLTFDKTAGFRLAPADDNDLALLLHEPYHTPTCPGDGCLGCSPRAHAELTRIAASFEPRMILPPESLAGALRSRAGDVFGMLVPTREQGTMESRVAAVRRMPAYPPADPVAQHLAGLARGLADDVDELQVRARRLAAAVSAAVDEFTASLSDRERAVLSMRLTRLRAAVMAAVAGPAVHGRVTGPGGPPDGVGMVPGQES